MLNILCLQDTNYMKLCAAQTINDIAPKRKLCNCGHKPFCMSDLEMTIREQAL